VIEGVVGPDRQPRVTLEIAGRNWPALIDTGFNGDLELPQELAAAVQARYAGNVYSMLADGRTISEDSYRVEFPFDGEIVTAEATFAPVSEILIGTRLLRNHRLEIRFAHQSLMIEREPLAGNVGGFRR
jgi:clan AA aspartic protease